jgi:hypothetical protein
MNALLFSTKIDSYIFDVEIDLNQKIDLLDVAYFLYEKGVREVSSSSELVHRIQEFGYISKKPKILKRVVSDDSLIPDYIPVFLIKKKYRVKGEVWDVHQDDVDPFPSSPHAHNYDQNIVMHLGNGKLYKKRECIGKAKKKYFLKLRGLIDNVELPKLEI